MAKFPKNFYWGAATSSHQVEGNNTNSDWWQWEQSGGGKEASGPACRHYELYKQDLDLAKVLNHNCHRFSLEWSRIEPQEGQFSRVELDHYHDVLDALKERDLEPILTLHHFTNPIWFAQKGGWLNPDSPEIFLRFVKRVVEEFSGKVSFWVTINEPIVYAYHAYALGVWPPQEKSFRKTEIVIDNLFAAHTKAYRSIHDIYREKGSSSPYVGFAKNVQAFYPCIPTLRNKIAVKIRHSYYNMNFIEKALRLGALDFIGINYYSRSLVETKNWTPASLAIDVCPGGHSKLKKNSLGWDIYPEGFYSLLMNFKKYNLPIFILENGICTDDDSLRWDFIRDHLLKVGLAMQDGVKVMGYIYWSLIDNYEWDKGFAPRFGLIDVNYRTFERKIRESAKLFGEVIKAGALE